MIASLPDKPEIFMSDLQIVSATVCPYAQRTRMVLLEKKIDFEVVEIDLKNKPDWFAGVSPYGKVPVLRHMGKTIYESAIINEYLDETFPAHPLMPTQPDQRALARIWIEYSNSKLCPLFYKTLLAQDEGVQSELVEKFKGILSFMELEGFAKLQGVGPFWMGSSPNLVDFTFYPFFERFCVLDHYRGLSIPEDCKRLRDWIGTISKHPCAMETANTQEFHINNYQKYADGSANGVTAREMKN
jgi:glutathione S-transferase